jgi:hypothetical protein
MITRAIFVMLGLLVSDAVASAQTLLQVTGRVTDAAGSPLPGTAITVTAAGAEELSIATADGRFEVRSIMSRAGEAFTVRFELLGFEVESKTDLVVPADGVVKMDARLWSSCGAIVDYVWTGAQEAMRDADAVIRLRLSPSMRVEYRPHDCQFVYALDTATVVDTIKMRLPEWRSAHAIPVVLMFEQSTPAIGSEYFAFLGWNHESKQFVASVFLTRVVNGRLETDLDRNLGLRAKAGTQDVVRRLRALCRATQSSGC